MIALLACLAVALLAAGIVTIIRSSSPTTEDRQVTVRNDRSVVTVRSACSGNITITFDPTDLKSEVHPVELLPDGDRAAENEVTLLEEFTDPKTSIQRKREIVETFTGLNCTFTLPKDTASGTAAVPGEAPPVSESLPDGEGCDEGYALDDIPAGDDD